MIDLQIWDSIKKLRERIDWWKNNDRYTSHLTIITGMEEMLKIIESIAVTVKESENDTVEGFIENTVHSALRDEDIVRSDDIKKIKDTIKSEFPDKSFYW